MIETQENVKNFSINIAETSEIVSHVWTDTSGIHAAFMINNECVTVTVGGGTPLLYLVCRSCGKLLSPVAFGEEHFCRIIGCPENFNYSGKSHKKPQHIFFKGDEVEQVYTSMEKAVSENVFTQEMDIFEKQLLIRETVDRLASFITNVLFRNIQESFENHPLTIVDSDHPCPVRPVDREKFYSEHWTSTFFEMR